jgi:type I restriction enzyme S subunit
MTLNNMREDWIEVELGEICFTTSGGTPSRNNIEFYQGSIPWVKSGELDKGIIYDTEEHISEDAVKNSSAKIFPEGTLLIALYGATIGKLAFLGVAASTNQAICGIYKSEAINSKYLFNFLLNRKQKLISQGTGGAQPNISQTILKKLEIPLAPLPIQRAIVSKIEALFSDLDNGIANFKKAQDQLKIYRQAVLKKAFEGELTKEWREGFVKTDDTTPVKTDGRPSQLPTNEDNLPKGWKWVNSGEFFSFVTSGSRGWAKYYSESGSVFIRITNLNFDTLNLDLREEKIQYVNPPKNSEGLRTKVEEGDFLFSITGYLGMFAIAPKLESAFVNQHVSLCRPKDFFNKKYLAYWIISKSGGHYHLNKNQKGAVKAGLNLDDLKTFPVPLPPTIQEQTQIVQEIERRLSVCDKMEQSISESIAKAEALRQSILKKAFEGKLLSQAEIAQCKQEADYEPASELLKKIQAEKVKTHGRASQSTSQSASQRAPQRTSQSASQLVKTDGHPSQQK